MKENASVSISHRQKPLRILANVGLSFLILLGSLCFFSAAWYVRVYGRIGFDSILFYWLPIKCHLLKHKIILN